MTSLGPIHSPGATEQCLNNSHGEDLGCLLQEEMGFTAAHDPLLPSAFGQVSGATALPRRGLRSSMEGSPRGLIPAGSGLRTKAERGVYSHALPFAAT